MTNVPPHPAEFSPEVIDVLAELIAPGEHMHDPYGGRGLRLGALCDRLGAIFTSTDIEQWAGSDSRVSRGDAEDVATYPAAPFTVVTSPTYVNKRLSDYAKVGPLPTTQLRDRRDYAISLRRPLHPKNTARLTGRHATRNGGAAYYAAHGRAVKHWGDRALVNVDLPIAERWCELLVEHGFAVTERIAAYTRRYGGLDNAGDRAEHEVVIVAHKGEVPERAPRQVPDGQLFNGEGGGDPVSVQWLPRGTRPPRLCAHCGASFTPRQSRSWFCSRRCRQAAASRARRAPRQVVDGQLFDADEYLVPGKRPRGSAA